MISKPKPGDTTISTSSSEHDQGILSYLRNLRLGISDSPIKPLLSCHGSRLLREGLRGQWRLRAVADTKGTFRRLRLFHPTL